MLFLKGLLNRVQITIRSSHTLDSRHYHAISLYGKHQAGTHSLTIQQDSTTTTDTVLTTYMGASMTEIMTKEIRKKQTHWHPFPITLPIHDPSNIAFFSKHLSSSL